YRTQNRALHPQPEPRKKCRKLPTKQHRLEAGWPRSAICNSTTHAYYRVCVAKQNPILDLRFARPPAVDEAKKRVKKRVVNNFSSRGFKNSDLFFVTKKYIRQ